MIWHTFILHEILGEEIDIAFKTEHGYQFVIIEIADNHIFRITRHINGLHLIINRLD